MSFSRASLLDIEKVAPPVVRGFRFAGVAAGIKASGKPDLGLILADERVAAAGVYTQNRVRAAPVLLAEAATKRGRLRAVLVNSGNANACTGRAGMAAARKTTSALAASIGASADDVAPASTGVIGALLPADKITSAIPRLLDAADPRSASDFARAILTTDRWPKVASRTFRLGRETATVLGMAKGAGMIHPNMATTLAFVVTDAGASPSLLARLLREAADRTFNAISVDGDTSTNDSIVLLASARAGRVEAKTPKARALLQAIEEVLGALAASIVADGEGAEHVVTFAVSGARTDAEARLAARTIATSPLVKTALHGVDANWGRILAAAGRSGAVFDPERAAIRVGDVPIVRRGMPIGKAAEEAAQAIMATPEYTVSVSLGRGPGKASYLTCDLGRSYIAINANYRT